MRNNEKINNLHKNFNFAGFELTDKQVERFILLADFMVEYNKNVNLTAITDFEQIIIKHFVDSIMILKYCDIPHNASFIDVGTGAGFPSLPIMIMREDLRFTLVDSNGKKTTYLNEVLQKLGLNAEVIQSRSEDLPKKMKNSFDFAIARAVAALPIICELCLPFVKVGGCFIAMKGSLDEIDNARKGISTLGGEFQNLWEFNLPNGDKRKAYIICKKEQSNEKYPRNYAQILRKPL